MVAAVSPPRFPLPDRSEDASSTLRVVLVTLSDPADPARPARLLPRVATRLAAPLAVPLCPVAQADPPASALAALLAEPGAWLAPLPLDPGLSLATGSWAEALGAWRQPTLLVVDQAQLATGIPAAATALLERWGVPLLGVLQWGGPWDPALRRRDALPWLGCLAAEEAADQDSEMALLLQLRWERCRAELD